MVFPFEGVIPAVCKIHNFRINSEREHSEEPNPSREEYEEGEEEKWLSLKSNSA
jgi:hypothetical protein